MKKIINTSKAPGAIGPYSQGVQSGNTVYFSGQLGIDPTTGKMVEGGVAAQAKQSLKNVAALLESVGATVDNVVKTTVYLTDMANFQEVNAAYSELFTSDFPARSCVAVYQLPLGGLVEVEVLAVL